MVRIEAGPSPTRGFGMNAVRVLFAVVVMVAFAVFAYFLVENADTQDQMEWERWVFVFGAVEAIAFAAIGWIFGREVNRERAEKAETRAETAADKEKAERAKGAKLAGMVIGGAGEGAGGLESPGAGGRGAGAAVEYAREAYPDV
jgi:cytochrome bd-type quinol oxidase subunit 1